VRTHRLKTWPEPFEAILAGRKTHEVRADDRRFAEGDRLILRHFVPDPTVPGRGMYDGRAIAARIGYLSRGPDWGIPEGRVVFTLLDIHAAPRPGDTCPRCSCCVLEPDPYGTLQCTGICDEEGRHQGDPAFEWIGPSYPYGEGSEEP
jgi:hypothetical protein